MTIPCLVFLPRKLQSLSKVRARIFTLAQVMGYLLLIMM
jgi:hypothetical protein